MKTILRGVFVGIAVLYPLGVYLGLQRFSSQALSLTVFLVVLARYLIFRFTDSKGSSKLEFLLPSLLIASLVAFGAVNNSGQQLLLMPAVIAGCLLFGFGITLKNPPSMVERFARVAKADLSNDEVAYCRRVTQIWCVFFVFNGLAALVTAVFTPVQVWAIYNGLVSYLLMGGLFLGEWAYRKHRFAQ